mmetsp:Transcript_28218/g.65534  ORF Transcript_28218/g.65534 Transcript_28218/m.65534 type:complete len:504 (+) Transcript_28218:73-1584(+)
MAVPLAPSTPTGRLWQSGMLQAQVSPRVEPAKLVDDSRGGEASVSTDSSWPLAAAAAGDAHKFTVRLDASPGSPPLGLVLATGPTALQVKNISEFPNALVQTWNREHATACILPGDTIVAVNGATGTGDQLVKEIRQGGVLELTVARNPRSGAMSASASEDEDWVEPGEIPECLVESLGGLRPRNALEAPSGTLLETYDLGESLGEGGYGCVRQATHKATGRGFAVKTITFEKLKVGKDYEQELVVLKRLSHRHIVHLSQVYQDTESMHFVMEYCEGGSLDHKLRSVDPFVRRRQGRAGLPDMQLEKAAVQILMSIAYLHHHRFVHRDLKPDNFLVTSLPNHHDSFILKLVDFGLSCRLPPGHKLKEVVGTTYYIAPEVLKGDYVETCDIWSAGVTLFHITIGTLPFAGNHRKDVFQKIVAGQIEWNEHAWRHVKSDFRKLVEEMLTLDAEARPSAKQLFGTNRLLQRKARHVEGQSGSPSKKSWLPFSLKGLMPKSTAKSSS